MNVPREGATHTAWSDVSRVFSAQRAAFARDPWPNAAARRDRLARVLAVLDDERAWIDAIDRDFGHRSAHETRLAELYVVGAEARHARRHVGRWIKPQRVPNLRRSARLVTPLLAREAWVIRR